ncbi:MAG: ABC transporter ATP-binding protein [Candidatus Bathyarchaeota archaeon]|jgi:iron(III) transport system ATP-binding protein|nr:ABC transporter ATP-binding protein [Candidatus Bathyarchaeota archaeon]
MVYVKLENLEKSFGSIVAVDNISLKIEESEFFTILGPSGCGKTTTLRMIAGFYKPDKGKIYFNKKLINRLAPEKRNIGMVFQNYALWPHMNVFKNVAFGLEMRKIPNEKIKSRVKTALDLVNLGGLGDRTPDQLSGGQQQRVALARALVIEPDVLLLDEPLSNLDAKLRVEMRTEIKKLQKNLGITTIYVTHDQKEALAVSDRLAVMGNGKIVQVGSPLEIYTKPANKFVASFIGLINLFHGKISKINKTNVWIKTNEGLDLVSSSLENVREGIEVILAVRPEHIEVHPQDFVSKKANIANGIVESIEYLGDLSRYNVKTQYQLINADQYSPSVEKSFKIGEKVQISFEKEHVHLIDIP